MQDMQVGACPKRKKESVAGQFAAVKYRSKTYGWTQKLNRKDYGVDKYGQVWSFLWQRERKKILFLPMETEKYEQRGLWPVGVLSCWGDQILVFSTCRIISHVPITVYYLVYAQFFWHPLRLFIKWELIHFHFRVYRRWPKGCNPG